MKGLKITLLSLLLILLFACNSSNNESQNTSETEKGKIITSIYPIEYIISEIAKEDAEVETVLPSGADPHSYEPSTKEMIELADSDGFFYIGEGFESFSATLAETVKTEGVHLLSLGKHTELFSDFTNQHKERDHSDDHVEDENHDHESHDEQEHEDEHAHRDFDPHFWLDPNRMVSAGELILEDLIALYPEHEEEFRKNFDKFKENMHDLDEQYSNTLSDEVNVLITHKSFSYLEQKYPIKQHSIRGLTSAQEPSQKELQALFKEIEELGINHIVLETNSEDRLAANIADELNLKKYYLSNLSTRTEEEIEQGKDYYDIMLDNLEVLKQISQ
ncbi:hypothetical protein E3U55_01965 [Filobacillus milosensis]|uniref:Adhesin n=1 Tax=Filobacillus milosensis TaxID=94137 RepID=A0A4Y8IR55_9BACI|nr:zinc ABC transporter substrate-binding protein [Filobacillus milosensis]TFB24291.1 hypothetical protein E3U55_01965 [Filobacillus milosensis]